MHDSSMLLHQLVMKRNIKNSTTYGHGSQHVPKVLHVFSQIFNEVLNMFPKFPIVFDKMFSTKHTLSIVFSLKLNSHIYINY
jgi:hypothetical protein